MEYNWADGAGGVKTLTFHHRAQACLSEEDGVYLMGVHFDGAQKPVQSAGQLVVSSLYEVEILDSVRVRHLLHDVPRPGFLKRRQRPRGDCIRHRQHGGRGGALRSRGGALMLANFCVL